MMERIKELVERLDGTNIVLEFGHNSLNASIVGTVSDGDYEAFREMTNLCKENGIIVNPLWVSFNSEYAIATNSL